LNHVNQKELTYVRLSDIV